MTCELFRRLCLPIAACLMSLLLLSLSDARGAVAPAATGASLQDQPAPALPADLEGLGARLPGLPARLAALAPDDPGAYFLLAEEVAAEARSDAEYDLARQLFALSYQASRRNGEPASATAAVCVALADLTASEGDRRYLLSLARSLDPRYSTPDWSGGGDSPFAEATSYQAAVAIGLLRAGRGRDLDRLLDDPAVAERFGEGTAATFGGSPSAAIAQGRRYAGAYPDDECRGRRVVATRSPEGRSYELCPICSGAVGPELDQVTRLSLVRDEGRLLGIASDSWAAQHRLDGGQVLRDPDPDEIFTIFAVRRDAYYWRGRSWSVSPD